MAIAHTFPGVFIEEIPSGVRAITGVPTSVAAFVGRTPIGPVNSPAIVNSFGDYVRLVRRARRGQLRLVRGERFLPERRRAGRGRATLSSARPEPADRRVRARRHRRQRPDHRPVHAEGRQSRRMGRRHRRHRQRAGSDVPGHRVEPASGAASCRRPARGDRHAARAGCPRITTPTRPTSRRSSASGSRTPVRARPSRTSRSDPDRGRRPRF